jgi:hypothetical protein
MTFPFWHFAGPFAFGIVRKPFWPHPFAVVHIPLLIVKNLINN